MSVTALASSRSVRTLIAAKIAQALNGVEFDMNKVVSIISGITYPHNMPTLFATLNDGSLWCATVTCDSSKSPNTFEAKWSKVDTKFNHG